MEIGRIDGIPAPDVTSMTIQELESELHHRDGLTRIRRNQRRPDSPENTQRRNDLAAEVDQLCKSGRPRHPWRTPTFPKGMTEPGEQMPTDPANALRDLFFTNSGRIRKDQMSNAVGRYSFTYGWKAHEVWALLVDEQYALDEGEYWVWPLAVPRRMDPA